MNHFSQDFIRFFKELEKNNNKEWFDQNRKRYENSVKKPFYNFIDELIEQIHDDDPSVQLQPKDAVLRINRDIRFSKDKTPYHTYVAAIISAGGKKDKSVPGVYIQLNAKEIRFYGGAHMIDKDQLLAIRTYISENLKDFNSIINDPRFTKRFGTIHGSQHKRIHPEFKEIADKQPLIANKNFYYYSILDGKEIVQDNLVNQIMDLYFAANPVKNFFIKALQANTSEVEMN